MKNMNKKSITLLIAVITMMLITVGGTLAYLVDTTDPVTNTFTPSEVKTTIDETFNGTVKSKIEIDNAADSIKVYVRVALVGNWVKDGQIVEPWTPSFTLGTDWVKHDGYYYYTLPVAPNASTSNLLGSNIEASTTGGQTLEVTVIHQAVQAEPASTVKDAWGVVISQGSVKDAE